MIIPICSHCTNNREREDNASTNNHKRDTTISRVSNSIRGNFWNDNAVLVGILYKNYNLDVSKEEIRKLLG